MSNKKLDISIDDVFKLDLRIGKVQSAKLIEGTELIEQEVYFGETLGVLKVLSKILISPQDMVGKSFPYIINLPPRKMKGVVSEGMIVATSDSSDGSLKMFETDAAPGSIIF